MASIKRNFFYNSLLTIANYLFPLLVFPYVSRVLGVNNIGACNYIDSIINIFILVSMLGIPTVGIREIVAAKGDKLKLSRVFSSILYLNGILTLIATTVLLLCIYLVSDFREHESMIFIGIAKLVGNYLLIEWFFKGIEDFKYITIRSIIVRGLYVGAVFLLVQEADDYILYFALTCGITLVNALINCIYARRYVRLTIHPLPLTTFIKPISILGIYVICTSLYYSFNTWWLGYSCGETEVGYYATTTKLFTLILALFSAFTAVMLPRMSSYAAAGDKEKFLEMMNKSLRALYAFVIPLTCFGTIYAKEIILFIAGPGFEGAVLPLQLCMGLLLIIGYEQIIIIQGLMPLKKDRAVLINSIYGGATALVVCFSIVGSLGAVGAAIVWICSEIVVTISASYFTRRYIGISFPWKNLLKNLGYYIPLAAIFMLLHNIDTLTGIKLSLFLDLLVGGVMLLLYSFILQYFILREPLFVNLIKRKVLARKEAQS